ncbi:hypothetical protein K2X85_10620 [bacterium]|nr:hypothetical protein [bacterium]
MQMVICKTEIYTMRTLLASLMLSMVAFTFVGCEPAKEAPKAAEPAKMEGAKMEGAPAAAPPAEEKK